MGVLLSDATRVCTLRPTYYYSTIIRLINIIIIILNVHLLFSFVTIIISLIQPEVNENTQTKMNFFPEI